MAKVIIPTPLRKFTGNKSTVYSSGDTILDVIEGVTEQHPGIKTHLIDEQGNIRSFIRIFIGDEDTRGLQGDNSAVKEDSVVSIVPAIAGGTGIQYQ